MPQAVYNLYEAKTHLSNLVERVALGEEIVFAKGGKPMARLVPLVSHAPRRPGGWEGSLRHLPAHPSRNRILATVICSQHLFNKQHECLQRVVEAPASSAPHCISNGAVSTSPNTASIVCTNRARNRFTCSARCRFLLLFMGLILSRYLARIRYPHDNATRLSAYPYDKKDTSVKLVPLGSAPLFLFLI